MLFDPSGQPQDSGEDDGLAALDLLELPDGLYRVMRLMLRHVEIEIEQLWEKIEALPEAERLSRAEFEDAVRTLIDQRWLIMTDETGPTTYRVNFRRKIGNVRTTFTPRTKRGSLLPQGIWDALDSEPKNNRQALDSDDNEQQ